MGMDSSACASNGEADRRRLIWELRHTIAIPVSRSIYWWMKRIWDVIKSAMDAAKTFASVPSTKKSSPWDANVPEGKMEGKDGDVEIKVQFAAHPTKKTTFL
jgi:hypothetical protein